jgi:S1-C subfamily serine protease
VSLVDLVLVGLAVASAIGGYRRGAILQAFGLLGLAGGISLAVMALPAATGPIDGVAARMGVAVGVVLVGGAVGNLVGWLAGSRVRARLAHPRAARTDAVLGATLSITALALTTWFLTLNLANGPFPGLSSALQRSRVVALLDDSLPPPPGLVGGLERAATLLGFPDVFVGLPPPPAPPVPEPPSEIVGSAARIAAPGTLEVLADGCEIGLLSEGSGFVAAPGLVVTNAHVVAGTRGQLVIVDGAHLHADVVAFDPSLDLAVLRVPDLRVEPLVLAPEEVPRSTAGAVLGFPGGPPLIRSPAAVRAVVDAAGRDIYGEGRVDRRLYELQAVVRPGSSGGPFVLPDGRVAGVVFASSTIDDRLAYALTSAEVAPIVELARLRTQPVGTGACV